MCVCKYSALSLFTSVFYFSATQTKNLYFENVNEKGCDPVGGSVQFSEGQVHI